MYVIFGNNMVALSFFLSFCFNSSRNAVVSEVTHSHPSPANLNVRYRGVLERLYVPYLNLSIILSIKPWTGHFLSVHLGLWADWGTASDYSLQPRWMVSDSHQSSSKLIQMPTAAAYLLQSQVLPPNRAGPGFRPVPRDVRALSLCRTCSLQEDNWPHVQQAQRPRQRDGDSVDHPCLRVAVDDANGPRGRKGESPLLLLNRVQCAILGDVFDGSPRPL